MRQDSSFFDTQFDRIKKDLSHIQNILRGTTDSPFLCDSSGGSAIPLDLKTYFGKRGRQTLGWFSKTLVLGQESHLALLGPLDDFVEFSLGLHAIHHHQLTSYCSDGVGPLL